MTTFPRMLAASFLIAHLFAATACAKEDAPQASACTPVVRDGWIRLVPGGMPMHAGFGRIENPCRQPVTITGATSDAYAGAELHETTLVDGVSRMRAVPELRIDANGAAELKPGGLHLMLMDPRAKLQAGQAVRIEFTTQDGRTAYGTFAVRAP